MTRVADRMQGTWVHKRDAAILPIHRTADACHASSTDMDFSGLPGDLCTTLGSKLP